jgi:hypothetical protein
VLFWFMQVFQLRFSSRGDVALLSNANLSVPDAPWYMHNLWANGHVGVVRSLLWDEEVRVSPNPVCKWANINMFRTTLLSRGAKIMISMLGHAYSPKVGQRVTQWMLTQLHESEVLTERMDT